MLVLRLGLLGGNLSSDKHRIVPPFLLLMMTIAPVSNLSLKSTGIINFTSKHRDLQPDSVLYQPKGSLSMAKKVSVIVLLAMSPLNSSSVEPYNPNYVPNNIEMVQQRNGSKYLIERELKSGNESIRYMAVSQDNNDKDFEVFGFNYDNKVGNKKGILAGRVVAVCETPRADGRYLMAYRQINNGQAEKDFKICYIPDVFGAYLNSYAKGWANNGALGSVPKSEFEEYFGVNNVKNAPLIKDRVTRYKPIK